MNRPPPNPGDPKPDDPGDPPPGAQPRDPVPPAWLEGARMYYSRVGTAPAHPVSVFEVREADELSDESPGRLCLRLEARSFWSSRASVLDSGGKPLGSIRPAGLIPWVSYAMHRGDDPVWTISVRNLVRTRHSLAMDGERWTIVTPFFARLDLIGGCDGVPAALGRVLSNWWGIWLWKIEPGRDTSDLLAALAFLHRQYGRS